MGKFHNSEKVLIMIDEHRNIRNARKMIFKTNQFNRIGLVFVKDVENILNKYIGCQITKNDNSLFKQVKNACAVVEKHSQPIDHYINGGRATVSIWLSSTSYDVFADVRCIYGVPLPNGCGSFDDYFERQIYIGHIHDHVLTGFYDNHDFKMLDENIEIAQLIKTQNAYNIALTEKEKLNCCIWEFLNVNIPVELCDGHSN
jgi:hypothetical protein